MASIEMKVLEKNANIIKDLVFKELASINKDGKTEDNVTISYAQIAKVLGLKDDEEETKRSCMLAKPFLRKVNVSYMTVPNGLRFNVSGPVTQEKKTIETKEPKKFIHVENNGEKFETMTGFETQYIAPKNFQTIKTLVESGLQVLLVGPPGCGKSRILEEIAKQSGVHCIRRQMSQVFDPEQLTGTIQIVKDEESGHSVTRFVPGSLTQCVQTGMFFIGDEYDNASAECNESLKMITEQGGRMVVETHHGPHVINKHDNFRISFTANTWGRGDDTGKFPNARQQNCAALDRIDAMISMDYDIDIERHVMAGHGIPNHVIEFFYGIEGTKKNADPSKDGLIPQLRTALKEKGINDDLGMRKIISFSKMYPIIGWHRAFLYGIVNKFEKDHHMFFEGVIKSKMGTEMVPTDDATKIKAASSKLNDLKILSGL